MMSEVVKDLTEEGEEGGTSMMNVSLDDKKNKLEVISSKKPPVSPRPQSTSPKPSMPGTFIETEQNTDNNHISKRCALYASCKSRIRSSSAGRNPQNDLRARYWAFLFENLHRAVDEIYQTCEMDESVVECKEAIMMLENYSKEFRSLIQWLNLNKDFENTSPPNRPTSLAWEVRKSSPGKGILRNVFLNKYNTKETTKINKSLYMKSASVQTDFDDQVLNNSKQKTEIDTVVLDFGLGEKPCFADISKIQNSKTPGTKLISTGQKSLIPVIEGSLPGKLVLTETKQSMLLSTDNAVPINIENGVSFTGIQKVNSAQNKSVPINIEIDPFINRSPNAVKEVKNIPLENKHNSLSYKEDNKKMLQTDIEQTRITTYENHDYKQSNKNENISNKETKINTFQLDSEKTTLNIKENSSDKAFSKIAGVIRISSPPLPQRITSDSVSSVQKKYPSINNNLGKRKSDTVSLINKKYETGKLQDIRLHSNSNMKGNIGNSSSLSTNQMNNKISVSSKNISGGKLLAKNENLNSSSSSLSSTSSGKSWADKVKGSLQELTVPLLKCAEEKVNKDEDDSDGWETVKVKNRSRNSPSKKLGRHLQAKSYPDIHMKQSKEQYSSTQSLKFSTVQNSNSNSITSAVNQQMKKNTSNIKGLTSKKYDKNAKSFCGKDSAVSNSKNENIKKRECSRQVNCVKNDSFSYTKSQFRLNRSKTDIKENCKNTNVKNETSKFQFTNENIKRHKKEISVQSINKNGVCVENNKNNLKNCSFSNNNNKKENIKNIKNIEISDKNEVINDKEDTELGDSNEKSEKDKSTLFKKIEIEISSDLSDYDSISNNSSDIKNDNLDFILNFDKNGKNDLDDQDSDGDLQMGFDEQEIITQDGMSGSESTDWDEVVAREEAQERISKLGLSWGDQMDHLDMELRPPGRALQMHEKLSSPYRKRSISESIRRHEEKQLKAQEKREKLLEEKTQRFKDIAKKVEEMKAWKEEQQQQRRITMEKKLRRAEEKRRMQLQRIVRKAHDEEEKVNEIAFINTLEAQNKRHDILSKKKDHEARLQDIQEERQRKLEEKAAKEAAAEERRKALEAKRQTRLLEMQEKRKLRDLKIEQQLQEKEKERQELANQKARDREQRLSALNAAQQATLEELQKKIQQKQEESARRHEENIELIRQKAFELSVRHYSSNDDDAPRLVPYETKKMCTLCNVLIVSEVYLLSHLRGKKHKEVINDKHQGKDPSTEELESYNLKHIVDAPADKLDPNIALDKERQKALKKRCKKLRQRMTNRGLEHEASSANKSVTVSSVHKQKIQKIIKELNKLIGNQGKGPWDSTIISSLERCLGELERLFGKCTVNEKIIYYNLGGISTFMKLLSIISNTTPSKNFVIPKKSIARIAKVYGLICLDCPENCYNILFSNKIGILLDYLIHCLNLLIPDNYTQLLNSGPNSTNVALPTDIVSGNLMQLLAIIIITWLSCKQMGFAGIQNVLIDQNKIVNQNEEFQQRVHDVISYTVSIGIVDKLSQYFNNVHGPIDSEPLVADFLLQCMTFLSALAKIYTNSYDNIFESKKMEDTTQLVATFRVTELVGTVSLLYGMLLHSGAPSRGNICPPELPQHTINVTIASLCMLNHLALMDLQMVQSVLGNEGLSLQLRHIASYLLWYCSHWTLQELLHEVILLVGYFTVLNFDNQMVIQSGQRPTVLQQLCSLPFQYFSDPELTDILFPSLIACCHNNEHNKAILEQEMSPELLSDYLEVNLLDIHQGSFLLNKKGNKQEENPRWQLSSRFPKNYWTTAKHFFSGS